MSMGDEREPDQSTKLKLLISSLPYVRVAPVVLRLVTPVEEAVLVVAVVNGTPTVRVQEERVSCCVTGM